MRRNLRGRRLLAYCDDACRKLRRQHLRAYWDDGYVVTCVTRGGKFYPVGRTWNIVVLGANLGRGNEHRNMFQFFWAACDA